MRIRTVSVTYPAWVDLVPSMASLLDMYKQRCQMEFRGDWRKTQCVQLIISTQDQMYTDGPGGDLPFDLNHLRDQLNARVIPHDFDLIDLDRPGQGLDGPPTSQRMRRTDDFELTDADVTLGRVPLWLCGDRLSDLGNLLASALLNPEESDIEMELAVWQDFMPRLDPYEAGWLAVAALSRPHLMTYFTALVEKGLSWGVEAIDAGVLILTGSPRPDSLEDLHQSHPRAAALVQDWAAWHARSALLGAGFSARAVDAGRLTPEPAPSPFAAPRQPGPSQ